MDISDEPVSSGGEPTPYEAPELTDLGSVADLTLGVVPTSTDGVLPGSLL